ncbi:choloylglycine hydrolase [Luteimonas chenhongjianii]|uniref:Choloylglycine hydrolase n=1 Tax=Luteimonas chenhongjianii TaxID=2006110 RepID=A0A290XIF4_9GAMM|nr:linear amide C-N hydrolase [Luteimonas chenhongjianii]ATD68788.1 choloylglycine hydrolase [Luteimonas chenhongjianii]
MRTIPLALRYGLGLFLLAATALPPVAQACSRLVYLGADDQVVTARSMDWDAEMPTNLWAFPRGMQRSGEVGPNSIRWTSRYGSVIAATYENSTADGMNEAGLVANALWLEESSYPAFEGSRPGLSIAAWAQYVLDNFATVQEAVQALQAEPFILVSGKLPGLGGVATVHLSLSDAGGDSAIIEYVDGRQTIHHSRAYQVMTNSPAFEKQLAMQEYWQEIGGTVFLPGTSRAADRFARASFYVRTIPKTPNPVKTIASVFSVIRNVSVPFGISSPDEPNIASTRWRTVSDHKRRRYFFESAITPNVFWVDVTQFDFSPATGRPLKLELGPEESNIYSGMVNAQFKPTAPFRFAGFP